MTDRKPHLLHVTIDWAAHQGIKYEIECPYDDLKAERPCAVQMECDHGRPAQPDSDQPHVTRWIGGEPQFLAGTDEAVATEWRKYFEEEEEYEEEHPNGNWESIDDCWVRQYVEMGYEDGWEFATGFAQEVLVGPVPVDYQNRGSFDDSYLVLKPWQEKLDGE